MSVLRKRFRTAFPKLPVPPVIIKVLPAKMLMSVLLIIIFQNYSVYLKFRILGLNRDDISYPIPRISSAGFCTRELFLS